MTLRIDFFPYQSFQEQIPKFNTNQLIPFGRKNGTSLYIGNKY